MCRIVQDETQYVKFTAQLYWPTPYLTKSQTTMVKTPTQPISNTKVHACA